jgi:hypothetical protein
MESTFKRGAPKATAKSWLAAMMYEVENFILDVEYGVGLSGSFGKVRDEVTCMSRTKQKTEVQKGMLVRLADLKEQRRNGWRQASVERTVKLVVVML